MLNMNKKTLVIICVIVLAVGGSAIYLLNNPSSQQTEEKTTEKSTQSNTPSKAGNYVDYSDDTIAKTSGTKLLFFHAPWCPQCRALDTDIKKSGVPDGVTIIKVDYDTNQQLRQKYGVTIQTTFVKVTDNGDLIEKFVAYDDPTLNAVVDKLL